MKKIIHILLALTLMSSAFQASTQTLSPSVISTGGHYSSSINGSISSTVGEAIIETFSNGSNLLSQGFQQPEVQVRTGSIAGPFCPGSNVSVPFTSSGILNPNNTFTAQLSDAFGSFSSPLNIGTFTGNTSSGVINALIPVATTPGSAYRIRVISSMPSFIGSDNGINISIINSCSTNLTLTLFLQGYYAGNQEMVPVLMNQGVGINALLVDSIDIELRHPNFPIFIMASERVALQTNGTAACNLPVTSGNYYIVVKHRNTVQTWSALPVSFNAANISYDFSSAATQASGSNMIEVSAGVWALYSGDVNQDENVDLLDLSLLEADVNTFAFGYYATDLNGDANVDLLDMPLIESNINGFVYSVHP